MGQWPNGQTAVRFATKTIPTRHIVRLVTMDDGAIRPHDQPDRPIRNRGGKYIHYESDGESVNSYNYGYFNNGSDISDSLSISSVTSCAQ